MQRLTVTEREAALLEAPRRRFNVDEYHRMIEVGILDEDEHIELLSGLMVEEGRRHPPQAARVTWLARVLTRNLGDDHQVRPLLPLTFGRWDEPEPDLAVVRTEEAAKDQHPSSAVLIVEVAGESLDKDRKVKSVLYARFGVPEYWIVNLAAEVVEVFTEPDTTSAAYRQTRTVSKTEIIVSQALPQISFPVADLFG